MAIDERMLALIRQGVRTGGPPGTAGSDPFWEGLRTAGSEIWLDCANLDEAGSQWCSSMSGLVVDSLQLNREVHKGLYDDFIRRFWSELRVPGARAPVELDRIVEPAFILNARHGLKLVNWFGCRVSVELHTDCGRDVARAVKYGLLFNEAGSGHFLVRLPFGPAGLLACRKLREKGVPVHMSLCFSARQAMLAALFARPDYISMPFDRINAYLADNRLGEGRLAGERVVMESRRRLRSVAAADQTPVRLVADGPRMAAQLELLAGVDVCLIASGTAAAARAQSDIRFRDRTGGDYRPALAPETDSGAVRLESLWEIPAELAGFARALEAEPPRTPAELEERGRAAGLDELFPRLSFGDLEYIAREGRIARHARWAERIRAGRLAIDSLLNLAGLAALARGQIRLDERIQALL